MANPPPLPFAMAREWLSRTCPSLAFVRIRWFAFDTRSLCSGEILWEISPWDGFVCRRSSIVCSTDSVQQTPLSTRLNVIMKLTHTHTHTQTKRLVSHGWVMLIVCKFVVYPRHYMHERNANILPANSTVDTQRVRMMILAAASHTLNLLSDLARSLSLSLMSTFESQLSSLCSKKRTPTRCDRYRIHTNWQITSN